MELKSLNNFERGPSKDHSCEFGKKQIVDRQKDDDGYQITKAHIEHDLKVLYHSNFIR